MSAVSPAPERSSARSRVVEVLSGAGLGVVSGFVLVGVHRMSVSLGGVELPWGLLFGAVFQIVGCVLLIALSGRKLPLAVFALVFAAMSMLFAGTSAGGGVLMPGEIAGVAQWQGWAVQIMGVLIPCLAIALVWARQIRALARGRGR